MQHCSEANDNLQDGGSDRNAATPREEIPAGIFDVPAVVLFNDIAGGTTEVIIEHEGQKYRLRATRNGRLLLNK